MRHALVLLLVVMLVGSAAAASTSGWQPVDNSGTLPDYVTVDWVVQTDTAWSSSELLVTLSAGEIFQQPPELGGSDVPPDPARFALPGFETLEFDTYLTAGFNAMGSVPTVTAGAADLGGGASIQFDGDGISVTWIDLEGGSVGDLVLARLSISKKAEGNWAVRLSTEGDAPVYQSGSVAELVASRSVVALAAEQNLVAPNGETPGDCNNDDHVDNEDLALIVQYWGWNGRATDPLTDPCPPAELTGDRFVGGADLDLVRANWGRVPEPSTVVLLVGASLFLLLRFRRP